MPSFMTAVVFTRYGRPDVLEFRDVPRPTPKDDEVLIRIHASSINSWDWELLNGVPFINRLMFGLFRPKRTKRILGADVAGVVDVVGQKVSRFCEGDEVFGDLWGRFGGFAEFVCAPESALEMKPSNTSFREAAAVPQAAVLALQALRKHGNLKHGHKVLINGAGGGVGTFAIQLAKLSGVEVTGVDAANKLEIIRSVGADHAIDFNQEDFTKSGQCYDLIIEAQNFRSMFDIRRALTPDGVYAMVGGSIPRVYQLWFLNLCGRLTRETRKLLLVAEGPNKGLAELKQYIEAGRLTPVIDKTYLLREEPDALRYFGEGRHRGKIAITVQDSA